MCTETFSLKHNPARHRNLVPTHKSGPGSVASPTDGGRHQQGGQHLEADTFEDASAASQPTTRLVQASASAPSVRLVGHQAARLARPAAPYAVVSHFTLYRQQLADQLASELSYWPFTLTGVLYAGQ